MLIYTTYQNRKQTLNKLKRLGLFSQISLLKNNRLRLTTRKPIYSTDETKIKKIQEKLSAIDTISPFAFYPFTKKIRKKTTGKKKNERLTDENYKRILHIFFDIDSTLTHEGVSTINKDVRSDFEDFKRHDCKLYFCSGRSYQDICRLMTKYNLLPYGIAESGGIILGMGDPDRGYKFGDRTEPDKLLAYLKTKNIRFKEDKNQQNRRTEVVIDKKSITKTKLMSAIKRSGADVDCHVSKSAYHITKKGVDKGTAIEHLGSEELELNKKLHKTVGMGDSDLDLPMLKFCDEFYAVKNADPIVKAEVRKNILKNKAPKAVAELYRKLFPFG